MPIEIDFPGPVDTAIQSAYLGGLGQYRQSERDKLRKHRLALAQLAEQRRQANMQAATAQMDSQNRWGRQMAAFQQNQQLAQDAHQRKLQQDNVRHQLDMKLAGFELTEPQRIEVERHKRILSDLDGPAGQNLQPREREEVRRNSLSKIWDVSDGITPEQKKLDANQRLQQILIKPGTAGYYPNGDPIQGTVYVDQNGITHFNEIGKGGSGGVDKPPSLGARPYRRDSIKKKKTKKVGAHTFEPDEGLITTQMYYEDTLNSAGGGFPGEDDPAWREKPLQDFISASWELLDYDKEGAKAVYDKDVSDWEQDQDEVLDQYKEHAKNKWDRDNTSSGEKTDVKAKAPLNPYPAMNDDELLKDMETNAAADPDGPEHDRQAAKLLGKYERLVEPNVPNVLREGARPAYIPSWSTGSAAIDIVVPGEEPAGAPDPTGGIDPAAGGGPPATTGVPIDGIDPAAGGGPPAAGPAGPPVEPPEITEELMLSTPMGGTASLPAVVSERVDKHRGDLFNAYIVDDSLTSDDVPNIIPSVEQLAGIEDITNNDIAASAGRIAGVRDAYEAHLDELTKKGYGASPERTRIEAVKDYLHEKAVNYHKFATELLEAEEAAGGGDDDLSAVTPDVSLDPVATMIAQAAGGA